MPFGTSKSGFFTLRFSEDDSERGGILSCRVAQSTTPTPLFIAASFRRSQGQASKTHRLCNRSRPRYIVSILFRGPPAPAPPEPVVYLYRHLQRNTAHTPYSISPRPPSAHVDIQNYNPRHCHHANPFTMSQMPHVISNKPAGASEVPPRCEPRISAVAPTPRMAYAMAPPKLSQ
jgi:hypothetical protein